MIIVALISMAIMGVIFMYLEMHPFHQADRREITFSCVITVAMWVTLAVIPDAITC